MSQFIDKRIVVTGLGLLTSIGDNVQNTWDNLISCKSGIRKISSFDTEDLSCKIAGHISNNSEDDIFFNESIVGYYIAAFDLSTGTLMRSLLISFAGGLVSLLSFIIILHFHLLVSYI